MNLLFSCMGKRERRKQLNFPQFPVLLNRVPSDTITWPGPKGWALEMGTKRTCPNSHTDPGHMPNSWCSAEPGWQQTQWVDSTLCWWWCLCTGNEAMNKKYAEYKGRWLHLSGVYKPLWLHNDGNEILIGASKTVVLEKICLFYELFVCLFRTTGLSYNNDETTHHYPGSSNCTSGAFKTGVHS